MSPKVSRLPESLLACQVQTPTSLANAMARALGDDGCAEWLEPCVGEGRLLQAASAIHVPPERVTGLDLDLTPHPSDGCGRVRRGVDFLDWSLRTDHRFDRVLSNPPYLSLSKFPAPIVESAQRVGKRNAVEVSRASNIWNAFLLATLGLLREGASICFLLPSAWDYAAYAAETRRLIKRHFARAEVFRCAVPLFEDVQEGSVVLLARGYRMRGKSGRILRRTFSTPMELSDALAGGRITLADQASSLPAGPDVIAFGELADVSIGTVTGDSRFFLLTEQRRRELRIPEASVRPILSRARHLVKAEIERTDWERLRDQGGRVWLFWPDVDVENHGAVQAYLTRSPADGGCRRQAFKVRSRDPWYQCRVPEPPHGFMSGMTSRGPWVSLSSMPGLVASNTLYHIRFREAMSRSARAAVCLGLLTTEGRRSTQHLLRRYADGLVKLEPSDVRQIRVPLSRRPGTGGAVRAYRRAVHALLTESLEASMAVADEWFAGAS